MGFPMPMARFGAVSTAFVALLVASACGSIASPAPEGLEGGASPAPVATAAPTEDAKAPVPLDASPSDTGTPAPVGPQAPFRCSRVTSMVTDTVTYSNWVGAWFDVTSNAEGQRFGVLLPGDEPNTPAVETQSYQDELTSSAPSVLAVGPNNTGDMPAQVLELVTDQGPLKVYMPALEPDDCVRTRLYVASDGSTYHSRADHLYKYSVAKANTPGQCFEARAVVGPDLTPAQAFVPQHLARQAPRP